MKYKIIVQSTTKFLGPDIPKAAEALAQQVNEHANDGWEPVGGVSICEGPPGFLMQAMVRRAES